MSIAFPFAPNPAKARILIVDDDVGTIRLLAQVVRDQGDVIFATGGADALAAARAEPPDLVLLDAEMEGMDGFQTCAALRALPGMADVPILFVTSHRSVESEARALAVGAVDFITKPFHPHIVEARVRTHLTLKQRTDTLLRLATLDGLTGIANRRSFDTALSQELRRILLPGASPLSLIMIDVDHFKRFNDFYGHQAGDDCLRAVAGALAGAARRAGDLVTRFGGEEFALLLPGCDSDAAMAAGERARRAVAALSIPHAGRPDGDMVSISGGVATLPPSPDGNPDVLSVAIVGTADQALYRAKATGRNRMACAQESDRP